MSHIIELFQGTNNMLCAHWFVTDSRPYVCLSTHSHVSNKRPRILVPDIIILESLGKKRSVVTFWMKYTLDLKNVSLSATCTRTQLFINDYSSRWRYTYITEKAKLQWIGVFRDLFLYTYLLRCWFANDEKRWQRKRECAVEWNTSSPQSNVGDVTPFPIRVPNKLTHLPIAGGSRTCQLENKTECLCEINIFHIWGREIFLQKLLCYLTS